MFLGAKLPLTKTIACRDGAFAVAPYPHVSNVTSYHETASNLASFHALLSEHARAAHCLFNGQLLHPLTAESRRGKTVKGAPREWVVFDFDKVDAKDHADVVKKFLPVECQNVSYIAQHSASMFVPGRTQWSGHIFMQLKEPSTGQLLREWFEALNFTIPALRDEISLTDSGIGLHWPLDRSAAYDSKLIYIAPPRTYGFTPTMTAAEAIVLVKKKLPVLKIGAYTPISKAAISVRVNELRKAAGLEELDLRTRPFEDGEVLVNAEPGTITDIKPMGEHYIKFNLNGGDSMGYWIDLRNPAIIKNFKGEPWLLTKEVDEKLYKQLSKIAGRIVSRPPLDEGAEVLAFYATNQNSKIKIGTIKPAQHELVINNSSETAARAWLAEFGVLQAGFLPHLDLIFDPTSEVQYVPGSTFLNTFSPTGYMMQDKKSAKASKLDELPPVTAKLLQSMLGDPTPEILAHFINWLAYIFQTRKKSETAWVITGRTGTGKGTFVKLVLRPLFGTQNVQNVQFNALSKDFNGYLENAMFVVFEECDTRAVPNVQELQAKLRHYVTDSPLQIRKMQTDHYSADNFTNFLFFANERTPVVVTSDDRRFNVTDRQEKQFLPTPNEYMTLAQGNELEAFADVLHRWPVDEVAVRKVIQTQARQDMHEATTTINQQIADAIRAGDLQFFIDRMPSDIEAQADFYNRFNPLTMFKEKIDIFVEVAAAGQPIVLNDGDLFALFRMLIPDTRFFQDSKTWRRRHYKSLGLDLDAKHRKPGDWNKQVRGILVQWNMPEGLQPKAVPEKVVPIKQRRKK